MDCLENQYYYNGECQTCQRCGPGYELSEDCGYGSGGNAYCVHCDVRTFKEDWGLHNCKRCLSCKQINRHQTLPCTSRRNTVCGECLPGFYSKTRIDGLQDLECMPCRPTSATERQCTRNKVIGTDENGVSINSQQQDVVSSAICGALITMAVGLSVLLFVCLWRVLQKVSKGPRLRSQDAAVIRNGEALILSLEKEVQTSGSLTVNPTMETSAAGDLPVAPKAILQRSTFPEATVTHPDLRNSYPHSCLELQPLMRSSTCSHCSSQSVSPGFCDSPDSTEYLTEESPSLLNLADSYCASDQQGGYRHAPVECTELDFQSNTVPQRSPTNVDIRRPTGFREGNYLNEDGSELQLNVSSAFLMQRTNR